MIDYDDDEVFALVLERDRLRIETRHHRMKVCCIETENDRLRLEIQHLREQGRQVEAERDKFITALEAIKSYKPDPKDKADPYLQIAVHTMRIARTALGLYAVKPS